MKTIDRPWLRIREQAPAPSTAIEHLRHEAADLRAMATRLEALADTLESNGPFDHPDLHTGTRPWRESEPA